MSVGVNPTDIYAGADMQILKYNDTGEAVRFMQRALNEVLNTQLKADGRFGKLTEESIRELQKRNGFNVNGIFGAAENALLNPLIERKYLKQQDMDRLSMENNLPNSIVKALRDVEARADGFLYSGQVIILFERHKFYRNLVRNFGQQQTDMIAMSHPDICNVERGGYLGYSGEYNRFAKAQSIHLDSAIRSTSYGLFQILGSNFLEAGYHSTIAFKEAMEHSELSQFKAFLSFIKSNPSLLSAIKQKNYEKIAILYNGKNQTNGEYAEKLRKADHSYVR